MVCLPLSASLEPPAHLYILSSCHYPHIRVLVITVHRSYLVWCVSLPDYVHVKDFLTDFFFFKSKPEA